MKSASVWLFRLSSPDRADLHVHFLGDTRAKAQAAANKYATILYSLSGFYEEKPVATLDHQTTIVANYDPESI